MDFTAIIPWIPKLAATLLVVLGILIALEIRAMWRKKNLPAPVNPAEQAVQVATVRFPDTGIHTESINPTVVPSPYKKLLISIPIIVIAIFVFITVLGSRINPDSTDIPTPTPVQISAQLSIYRLGEAGDLELFNYDELKELEPNTSIVIAVTADQTVEQATFTINGEEIASDTRERTPNGELFVNYILKPGVADYHISVRVQ